jgi:hypothetical protein
MNGEATVAAALPMRTERRRRTDNYSSLDLLAADYPTNLNPTAAKWWSNVKATRMRARFMIAKLVASTADSL